MYRILLLLILSMTVQITFAQEPKKPKKKDLPLSFYEDTEAALRAKMVGVARNYVAGSIGLGLPENDFGSSFEDQNSGYAKVGILLSGDAGYVIKRNIGISGTFSMYTNGIKKRDYENNLIQNLPNGASGNLKSGRWFNMFIGGGPFIALPEEKVTLDIRALMGFMVTSSPNISYNGSYGEEIPFSFEREGAGGVSPALIVGVSVSYPIPNWLDMRAFIKGEYIGARPPLKYSQRTISEGYNVGSELKYNQTTGSFMLAIGIKYEFGYSDDAFILDPE